MKDDDHKIKSYINPSHGTCDPVGTFSSDKFCGFQRVDFSPCLAHSRIQNVHQTNARVRKCTCDCKCPKRTFLDNCAPFSPVVNIWNVAQWYLLRIFLISLGPCRAKLIFLIKNGPNGGSRRMFPMDCNARTCTGVAFGGSRALKLAQV